MIGIENLDVKIEGTLNDTTIDFPKQLQRALVTFKNLHWIKLKNFLASLNLDIYATFGTFGCLVEQAWDEEHMCSQDSSTLPILLHSCDKIFPGKGIEETAKFSWTTLTKRAFHHPINMIRKGRNPQQTYV